MIEKNERYRLNHDSPTFLKKYGTARPEIRIEGEDRVVFGKPWYLCNFNIPAIAVYMLRELNDGCSFMHGKSYYGKIGGLGELVHESELEVIEE